LTRFAFLPIIFLTFWKRFKANEYDFPLIIAAVVCLFVLNGSFHVIWRFHIQAMPLELYHFPCWTITIIRYVFLPWLASELSDKALEPKARKRAAELCQLAGIDVDQALAASPKLKTGTSASILRVAPS
jgi:hypothetical protein